MAFANIRPKRTDTAGRAPSVDSMLDGEIFINRADKSLGFKASNNTIQYIVAPAGTQDDLVHKSGEETITGSKTFTAIIYSMAMRTLAADLAENYEADQQYPVGTLVQFGGKKEITVARTKANGVISDKPGYLMNDQRKSKKCWLPITMIGRTPIRVFGRVEKFDKLVLSTTPGVAIVDNSAFDDEVIGIALKSKHTKGEGKVLCFSRVVI